MISFPTKLYQKFDVGSCLEILRSMVSKTTLNELALDNFVYKRKMSGGNYSMAKNMLLMANMLNTFFPPVNPVVGEFLVFFDCPSYVVGKANTNSFTFSTVLETGY